MKEPINHADLLQLNKVAKLVDKAINQDKAPTVTLDSQDVLRVLNITQSLYTYFLESLEDA